MNEVPPITVECSPGTFERLQCDSTYRNEFTQEILKNNSVCEDFIPLDSPIIPEETNECFDASYEEDVAGSSKDVKQTWLEKPTKILLSLIEELSPKVGKCIRLKTKRKMWEVIKEKLAEEGFEFSVSQIETKYRGLERQYKKTKIHNNSTGRNRITCPFQNELDNILKNKRGVYPEYVLDENQGSSDKNKESEGTSTEVEPTSGTERSSTPSGGSKMKKVTAADILHELHEMRREKEQFHENVIKMMQLREERKEARAEKKLKLLEKLLQGN